MKFVKMALHRCYTLIHFSIQPTRPLYAGGWSVGWWYQIVSNFPRYSGAQIHSLGQCAFQAVGSANFIISVIIPCSVVWAGYWITMYIIVCPHLATFRVWYCL